MVAEDIRAENVYNIDEIGFLMGCSASAKVVEIVRHPRTDGKLFHSQDGNREMVTVLECICADGTALDPLVIYKAAELDAAWFEDSLDDIPENMLFAHSGNGWTNSDIAMEYLERHFGPGSVSERKAAGAVRVLCFDGHTSHVNGRFLQYCVDHRIIPICLPPHTTHKLQPLDVGIFSPYKNYYSEELKRRFDRHERSVTKQNFHKVLLSARPRAFREENIKSAFRKTGLFPADPSDIISDLTIKKQCREGAADELERPSSPPLDLAGVPLEAVRHIPPPHNPHTLQKTGHALINFIERLNVPETYAYRARVTVEGLMECGEKLFTREDEQNERIRNLETEVRMLKDAKKKQRRMTIPESGFVLRDKAAVEKFLAAGKSAEMSEAQSRVSRTESQVSRLEEKLGAEQAIFEKHEAKEKAGTLGKRCRPSSKVGESVQKLRDQLAKAQLELSARKQHLQELQERDGICSSADSDEASGAEDGQELAPEELAPEQLFDYDF
jgi:polyhydroxyalkanoate synthesis regulator phasin